MTDTADDQDRRDARTVEIALALLLGVVTFVGLVVAGWALDHLLQATAGASLAPFGPALLVTASVLAIGVVVRQLVRARRRGL